MSDCYLCKKRAVLYGMENGNKGTWQLSYNNGKPVLRVSVDNHHLGITLSNELMIHHCPLCGKEL